MTSARARSATSAGSRLPSASRYVKPLPARRRRWPGRFRLLRRSRTAVHSLDGPAQPPASAARKPPFPGGVGVPGWGYPVGRDTAPEEIVMDGLPQGPTASDGPHKLSRLPGREWWQALRRTVKQFQDDNLSDWAAALTYYGVQSIFPGL